VNISKYLVGKVIKKIEISEVEINGQDFEVLKFILSDDKTLILYPELDCSDEESSEFVSSTTFQFLSQEEYLEELKKYSEDEIRIIHDFLPEKEYRIIRKKTEALAENTFFQLMKIPACKAIMDKKTISSEERKLLENFIREYHVGEKS
jgi:hypothetical protein